MKRLLFIVNVDWFFVSHRLPIAIEAINQGYEVHIACAITDKSEILKSNGLIVHPLNMHRSKGGFFTIINEFAEILSLVREVSPNILHLVTIKPVLLGGITARLVRVPSVVSAVSGLGFVFVNRGLWALMRRKVIAFFYRIALGHINQKVIFQNISDQLKLSRSINLQNERVALIHGSGVDLSIYTAHQKQASGLPIVLFASRLLADKGVNEFISAATIINSSEIHARFVLVGEIDPSNPSSIQQDQINQWVKKGDIEFWGYQDDMVRVLSQSTIVVLPSYYGEGLPKILIEAAACARAVITTDHPGCRDAIEDGVTGILVPVRNAGAIANAIKGLLRDPKQCEAMGRAGRQRAEKMFDVKYVVSEHIRIYNKLLCYAA